MKSQRLTRDALESPGGAPGDDAEVEVREVSSRSERRAFLRLPWRLYRSDPHWVPPLLSEVKATLDAKRNPFFRHAETRLYVAWRAGRPVGRIAATVDHLHVEHHRAPVGFWGFFETEDDPSVAQELLDCAAADLRRRGMTEMQGPASPSVHSQCGLLVEGFEFPPSVFMPYNPPHYPALVERVGLRPIETFYAYFLDTRTLNEHSATMARLERLAQTIRKRHSDLTIRTLDLRHFEDEVRRLGALFETTLSENWFHTPMPEEDFLYMARGAKAIIDPDLVLVAEVDGEPAGCVFGVPDINPLLRKANGRLFPFGWLHLLRGRRSLRSLRIIGYGVLPAYRSTGAIPLLMYEIIRNAQRKGYAEAELSWITEVNVPSFRTVEHALGPRLYKRYRFYAKSL